MKRTKQILLVLAFATIGSAAMAQAQFSIGIKGGLNFAKIDTEDVSTKNRTGFHGGAFALIKLTKIGIQPEVLFSQQGTKLKVDGQDLESNFSYVNVPIIFKLYTIAGINLQVGPQFGFVTSAKQDQYNVQTGDITEEDVKDDIKGSDVSLALGAGWDLPFGLSIDARYNWGLSDINKNNSAQTIKNQVWQVSVGYKLFQIGK